MLEKERHHKIFGGASITTKQGMQTYGQHIEQGLLQSINRAIMSTDGGEALTKQRKREGFTKYL